MKTGGDFYIEFLTFLGDWLWNFIGPFGERTLHNQAVFDGVMGELWAISHVHLLEDAGAVGADGFHAQG